MWVTKKKFAVAQFNRAGNAFVLDRPYCGDNYIYNWEYDTKVKAKNAIIEFNMKHPGNTNRHVIIPVYVQVWEKYQQ